MRPATAAAVAITAAPAVADLTAVAAAVFAAGQHDGADTGKRVAPRPAEHGGRRLDAVLAGPPHPVRDQPGHDRAGERGAAPLRHAVELTDLSGVRVHIA